MSTIMCGYFVGVLFLATCYLEPVHADNGGAFVTIYAGKSYQGRQRELYVENNMCFPLFGDWAVITQSVKFDQRTCIQLYEGADCEGRSKVLNGQFQIDRAYGADLESIDFDRKVQSIHLC